MAVKNIQSYSIKNHFINMMRGKELILPSLQEPVSRLLSLDHIDTYYQKALAASGDTFLDQIINALNVKIDVSALDIENIPRSGGAIIVSNHPYGGIDGVLLGALLQKVRPDFKLLVNQYLKVLPELNDYFLYVDVFDTAKGKTQNISALRQARRFLADGGLLVLFPAGSVSYFHFDQKRITDPPWQENMTRLIQNAHVPVVPVYFDGHNKIPFQVAGMVHPLIRTLLLPREMVNKQNRTFRIAIGKPIGLRDLDRINSIKDKTEYLRRRTYNLANRYRVIHNPETTGASVQKEIVKALQPKRIAEEIGQLPGQQILYKQNNTLVFYAGSEQIPDTLYEIGRIRETVYRIVGEGSGKSLDLDYFDYRYLHLVAWDESRQKIIGAYRLGLTDRIIRTHGINGLYASTLFNFKSDIFSGLGKVLELGRSFVAREYQRQPHALYLLWRGIGAFVAKYPQYHTLVGMVSISNHYRPASQLLMLRYLKKHHWNAHLASMVQGKSGHRIKIKAPGHIFDTTSHLDELQDLVCDVEQNTNGIPVLIRQYLKLGAEFMGFNRDMDFSNVLDGLILVDLLKTEPRLLRKYFGVDGTEKFYAFHQRNIREGQDALTVN